MKIIFLLLLSLSFNSFANSPTCSQKGTVVIYTNGIDSSAFQTQVAFLQLKLESSSLNEKIDTNKELVSYESHYNHRSIDNDAEWGEYLDFMTTGLFLVSTSFKDEYGLTVTE